MNKGRLREINKPANWAYIYLGLKVRCISRAQALVMTGLTYYALCRLIREEKEKEEEQEKQLELTYGYIMEKHNLTNSDMAKFHLILKEVISMGVQTEGIGALLGREAKLKSNKKEITSFFNRTEEEEREDDQE